MTNRRQFVQATAALGAVGATSFGPHVFGQGAWPSKPVRVVNPFPAGGGVPAAQHAGASLVPSDAADAPAETGQPQRSVSRAGSGRDS